MPERGYFRLIAFTQIMGVDIVLGRGGATVSSEGLCLLQHVSRRSKVGFGHGLQHYGIPDTIESKRDFGNRLAGHLDCLQLRRYRFDCTVIIETLARS